jgi:hypothetical protein
MSSTRRGTSSVSAAMYLRCRGPGSILLGNSVLSSGTREGGMGSDASSLAPIARALSATKRWSVEYWFLKNSWMSALFQKYPSNDLACEAVRKSTNGGAFLGAHETKAFIAPWRFSEKPSRSKLSCKPKSAYTKLTAFSSLNESQSVPKGFPERL